MSRKQQQPAGTSAAPASAGADEVWRRTQNLSEFQKDGVDMDRLLRLRFPWLRPQFVVQSTNGYYSGWTRTHLQCGCFGHGDEKVSTLSCRVVEHYLMFANFAGISTHLLSQVEQDHEELLAQSGVDLSTLLDPYGRRDEKKLASAIVREYLWRHYLAKEERMRVQRLRTVEHAQRKAQERHRAREAAVRRDQLMLMLLSSSVQSGQGQSRTADMTALLEQFRRSIEEDLRASAAELRDQLQEATEMAEQGFQAMNDMQRFVLRMSASGLDNDGAGGGSDDD